MNSKWNPVLERCRVCGQPPYGCSHSQSDVSSHLKKMKDRQKEDKRIEQLVKKLVDQELRRRGL